MPKTRLFQLIITSILISFSTNTPICTPNANVLQCFVTGISTVDTNSYNLNGISSMNIIYNGSVILNIKTSSINYINIQPLDESDTHTLQISAINSTAMRIEIEIRLSTNQLAVPLFTSSNYMVAPTSTLSINIEQTVSDASNFTLFDTSSLSMITAANYEIIFNRNSTTSGVLNFPNLIRGLNSALSITIFGNNHILAVNGASMPASISVNRLSLKNLRLNDQILYNIINLKEYSIEECEYNMIAQFLQSNQKNNISLLMKNNNPLDGVLPNRVNAFSGLLSYISITLIEPKLTSMCLEAFGSSNSNLKTLILNLGVYNSTDFYTWKSFRPYVWYLTINNIQSLDIFPVKFFNSIDPLHKLTLNGSFKLEKKHICTFVGTNVLPDADPPIVSLISPQNPTNWDTCADTYIKAINIKSIGDIKCPPQDTCNACAQWAQATAQCDLISYENSCTGVTIRDAQPFFYNSSYLYYFFQNRLWLNRTTNCTASPMPKGESMNIGAIIGALCGLLVAIIILGITVFCICRYRRNASTNNTGSTLSGKYIHSSNDLSHVSIATSSSSQSSHYALEKSFFPPMQPNDEIAPPLYTATSESARSASAYNSPSAPLPPPSSRASISTHATHVYETLDS